MNYRLSNHARQEMKRRSISLADVESVLAGPGQIVQEHGGIVCYQSLGIHNEKSFLLRVMLNDAENPMVVVTLYKTSKINKYWQL